MIVGAPPRFETYGEGYRSGVASEILCGTRHLRRHPCRFRLYTGEMVPSRVWDTPSFATEFWKALRDLEALDGAPWHFSAEPDEHDGASTVVLVGRFAAARHGETTFMAADSVAWMPLLGLAPVGPLVGREVRLWVPVWRTPCCMVLGEAPLANALDDAGLRGSEATARVVLEEVALP